VSKSVLGALRFVKNFGCRATRRQWSRRTTKFWASTVLISGFGASSLHPLLTDIVDEAMFLKLQTLGLKGADARHLMYALCNGCVRFVTTDPDFLKRRSVIEAAYAQVRIVMPTELLQQMEQLR